MRRALAVLLAVPLVGLVPALTPPAVAGDDHYVAVRALDDRFTVVGEDCAGADGALPTVRIGASDTTWRGEGSARVTAPADTVGGLMVHDPHPLRGVQYGVDAVTGRAPQGRWRVEANGDVLTSDPVDLSRGDWSRVWLEDAVLHGPDGWTGSIEDYIAQFGHRGHWSAGLLTGPCLGSGEVRLDGIGTRHTLFDFEPRAWVTVRVGEAGPRYDGAITAGERFVVRAVAHRWDVATDRAERVRGADLVLQRRWTGTKRWRTVARIGTWHGTSDRSASWRAAWHRPTEVIRSGTDQQPSWAEASEPVVDGHRCHHDPDVLPFPPTCKPIRVAAGTVTITGTGGPPGAVRAKVTVRTGDFDGPRLTTRRAVVGRDGGWRVTVDTGSHDHLYLLVTTSPTSPRHELVTEDLRFPLEVR
ncbi:MAG TPA: hypothetical protein VFT70_18290 [Nocardioides sp.]|nr:hypothetical protein [Nocardioides sp.]